MKRIITPVLLLLLASAIYYQFREDTTMFLETLGIVFILVATAGVDIYKRIRA